MTNVVQVGPIALSMERLAALLSIWLFLLASAWIAKRFSSRAGTAGWYGLIVGIAASRIGYVAQNLDAFRVEPMAAFFIWQGGFAPFYGIAAAALLLVYRVPEPARWMSLGSLAVATACWLGFTAMLDRGQVRSLPPAGNLVDIAGRHKPLSGTNGPFIVNFWASWCPPCQREMPVLHDVARDNADIPILFVNVGEPAATVRAYASRQAIDADRVMIDRDGSFAAAAGGAALPTTLFVDAEGQIIETHSGEISRAALVAGVRELRRPGR